MSLSTAREQIIEIIEGVKTTTSVAASGSGFKYVDTSGDVRIASTRSFFLKLEGGAVVGPLTSQTRIFNAEMDVSVFYQEVRSSKKEDEIISEDYQQIANALLDVTQWAPATSKIRRLTVEGSSVLPYMVDETDEGKILTITIDLEYE
jgi:hypothetical protein|tara:strand:- start:759 stop:1202 length:444 start_codon:yes stop_codon:yes gene_type:complete